MTARSSPAPWARWGCRGREPGHRRAHPVAARPGSARRREGLNRSLQGNRMAAATTVVQRPSLWPTAVWVTSLVL